MCLCIFKKGQRRSNASSISLPVASADSHSLDLSPKSEFAWFLTYFLLILSILKKLLLSGFLYEGCCREVSGVV